MREFMERGAVVIGSTLECGLWRKMNSIRSTVVKGVVALIVADVGAGILQHGLASLSNFPLLALSGGVLGNAIDLACIEDGVDSTNRSGVSALGFAFFRVGTAWRASGSLRILKLPKLD